MQNPIAQVQRKARGRLVRLMDSHTDAAKKGGDLASFEWGLASDAARVLSRLDPAIAAMESVEDQMDAVSAVAAEGIAAIFAEVVEGKKAKRKPRQVAAKKPRRPGKKGGRGTRKPKAKKTGRTKGSGAAKQTTAQSEDPARVAIESVLRKHGKDTPPADVVRFVKEHGHDVTPMKVGAVRRNFKE